MKPRKTRYGYVVITVDGKTVLQHRHVVEIAIGRKLIRGEEVHHVNHDKTDNRLENLEIVDRKTHAARHRELRWSMQRAVEMRQSGCTFIEIGKTLGMDPITIQSGLIRHGHHQPKPPKQWCVKSATELLQRGVPTACIAKSAGVDLRTIQRLARKIGVKLIPGRRQQAR